MVIVASACPAGGDASTRKPDFVPRLALRAPALRSSVPGIGRVYRAVSVGSHSLPQLDPSALRVVASNFAPATVTEDVVENNTDADDRAHDQFAQFHTTSYATLGRISGNIQIADWKPAGGSVVFWYLGSFMTSAAAAQAAQADSVAGHQNLGGQPKPCQNGAPPPANFPNCNYVLTQDVGKTTYFADFVWAIGTCLIETDAQFPQSLGSATSSQIITTLDTITSAAAGLANQICTGQGGANPTPSSTAATPPTPTATPTKTRTAAPTPTATATKPSNVTLSILDVRVEKSGAKADLTRPPLQRVKVSQKVLLAIYVEIDEGAAGTPLSFTFVEKAGRKQVLSKSVQDAISPELPIQLRETVPSQPLKRGKYALTATVSYQGRSSRKSTKFAVEAPAKKQCVTIGGQQYCS
jgi:hypothetical protein